MYRTFKELDGTVENVGQRMVDDYTTHLGDCSDRVGKYATEQLVAKLASPQFVKLGFTDDILTVPLGEVEFGDEGGMTALLDELIGTLVLDPSTDLAFLTGSDLPQRKEHIAMYTKANMNKAQVLYPKYVNDLADKNQKKYRVLLRRAGLPTVHNLTSFMSEIDIQMDTPIIRPLTGKRTTLLAFSSNTPCEETSAMKPSKWLAKYIEKLIPGITERYSALFSATKAYNSYLTIDPSIMLNCSESATFSSCFRFDGEYHYSAQRFLNGLETAMLVTFNDSGHINYRCWTMINATSSMVVTLRSYADIPPKIIGAAMKKRLRSHVLGTTEYVKEDLEGSDCVHFDPEGDTYVDPGYVVSADLEYHSDCVWYIDSGYAIDPSDGCVTEDADLNSCSCEDCGERTSSEELRTVNSGHNQLNVCDYCIENEYAYVEDCGEYYHHNEVMCLENGRCFHQDDADEYVYYNDEWYEMDECTTVNSGELIPDCYLESGDYVLLDDTYYHVDELYYSDETEEYYATDEAREIAETDAKEAI